MSVAGEGIGRDLDAASGQLFDLIVVGGGIQGIMVALEASRRRLRPLLLERADFGGGMTAATQRLLQDEPPGLSAWLRTRGAADERLWWGHHFPAQVKPTPVILPVMKGERAPKLDPLGRIERGLYRLRQHHRGPGPEAPRDVTPDELVALCPGLAEADLAGGLTWSGLALPSPARLCLEALRWACMTGATALNYVEVTDIVTLDRKVIGVDARDRVGGSRRRFQSPVVIAAAGPWTFDLLGRSTVPEPPCRPTWSVLIARPLAPSAAVVWRPDPADRATSSLTPAGEGTLIGPVATTEPPGSWPDWHMVRLILDRLRRLMPALEVEETEVLRLSSSKASQAAVFGAGDRALIVDAARRHGPAGLYALIGGRLVGARRTADQLLERAFPAHRAEPYASFKPPRLGFVPDEVAVRGWLRGQGLEQLLRLAAEESVIHLDDLILRRTPLADWPGEALQIAEEAGRLLRYDEERRRTEMNRLRRALAPPHRRLPAWLRAAELDALGLAATGLRPA